MLPSRQHLFQGIYGHLSTRQYTKPHSADITKAWLKKKKKAHRQRTDLNAMQNVVFGILKKKSSNDTDLPNLGRFCLKNWTK